MPQKLKNLVEQKIQKLKNLVEWTDRDEQQDLRNI